MEFRRDHLSTLLQVRRTYSRANEERGARTGHGWVSSLGLGVEYQPRGIEEYWSRPDRETLFRFVADPRRDTATLCAVILAWGGMHVRHGREFLRMGVKWRDAAEKIRLDGLSRAEAYAVLHELRLAGALPGMGPAFFTKLVFFLRGREVADPGYIMDQWTGCSVNLLTGDPNTVLMNATYAWTSPAELRSDFQVSDKNDAHRYERFCSVIDHVAVAVSLDPIDAELLLTSRGRGRGTWRRHVLSHRQAPTVEPGQGIGESINGIRIGVGSVEAV